MGTAGWFSEADRLDVVDPIAEDLAAESVDLPGVSGPTEIARHFAAVWADRTLVASQWCPCRSGSTGLRR
jgi:hypothetical protein